MADNSWRTARLMPDGATSQFDDGDGFVADPSLDDQSTLGNQPMKDDNDRESNA